MLGSSSGLGRCPFKAEITGSNPVPSTILNYIGLPTPVGNLVTIDAVAAQPLLSYMKQSDCAGIS